MLVQQEGRFERLLQTKVVYIKCRRNPLLAAVSSVRPPCVCLCIVVLRRCCVLAQFNQPLQCQGGAPASASAAQLASRQARKLPGCWSTQCGRHPSLCLPPPTPRLLAEARRGRARWSLCRNISQLCRRALTTFLPQSRGLSSVKTCRSRRVLVSETMNHGPV